MEYVAILEIDCGTTLFTNTSGNISFPRNPTGYPATVNCTYTISAKDLTYIWIHDYATEWTHLLNSFQDCSTEWLMVVCVLSSAAFKNNF